MQFNWDKLGIKVTVTWTSKQLKLQCLLCIGNKAYIDSSDAIIYLSKLTFRGLNVGDQIHHLFESKLKTYHKATRFTLSEAYLELKFKNFFEN